MANVQLFRGDCLEIMNDIQQGSVDMVLTSPPYDNLREYNGNIVQWSFDKFKEIAREIFRVTKPCGVVVWIVADMVINGGETGTSFKQALWFMDCGFLLHDTMIWYKKGCIYPDTNRYYSSFEYMFVFSKGKPKTANMICDRVNAYSGKRSGTTYRNQDGSINRKRAIQSIPEFGRRFNVWEISGEKHNTTGHPAVFPVELARDHIISWSNAGDVVLDPFMGSGSTGVACVNTGRDFIGIELDAGYYDTACRRIEAAQAQLRIDGWNEN